MLRGCGLDQTLEARIENETYVPSHTTGLELRYTLSSDLDPA